MKIQPEVAQKKIREHVEESQQMDITMNHHIS
jgi:hypothetical protein